MKTFKQSCPLDQDKIIDLYFLEHRAKLIDIAAFLDRMDRAQNIFESHKDFRMTSMEKCLGVLMDGQSKRVSRILDIFSDQTKEPIISAAGAKKACGAWPDINN